MREPSRDAPDPRRGRPLPVATVAAAALVLAGAGTGPLPAQVVPDTVQPAPAHRGAESPRIPPGERGGARVPPRATAPHVLLTRAGQPLSGAFELTGTLRRGEESRLLVFEPADQGEPILIGYALPGDMQVTAPEGPVRLTARAEPELPTSTYSVSLAQERTAALGVVWAVEPEPVTFRAGPLRIRQRGEPGGESRAVPAVVEGGEQTRELPLGEALTVVADGQRYRVYLQSSAYLRSPDDSDGPETGFLLRASVVPAGGR